MAGYLIFPNLYLILCRAVVCLDSKCCKNGIARCYQGVLSISSRLSSIFLRMIALFLARHIRMKLIRSALLDILHKSATIFSKNSAMPIQYQIRVGKLFGSVFKINFAQQFSKNHFRTKIFIVFIYYYLSKENKF